MNTRHTRVLTLTWPSGKPMKLRDIADELDTYAQRDK